MAPPTMNASTSAHAYPKWLQDTVIHQIFPASFQDSNGDGIGDLNGINDRLDYIKSLGVETIWLSPIHPSPFRDAGYDVSDYRAIAPRYGTMADFERLVHNIHARGMKLLLDFVPGHTSTEHPWFKESCKHERNAYSDRYVWTDTTFRLCGNGPGQFVSGHGERDGSYLANFYYFQPALNYGYAEPDPAQPWQMPCTHPAVQALREEMCSILRFWLDKGVDGFRVDMAGSLIKGNNPIKVQQAMIRFWSDIRAWWDREYPEAVLLAEWSDPSKAIETGFHIDFMIHFNRAGYMKLYRAENKHTIFEHDGVSYFRAEGGGETQSFFSELQDHLAYIRDRGLISIPSGNHDLPRFAVGRSQQELKNILTFIYTLPVIPTLYYGDEIGMQPPENLPSKEGAYRRTGARTPMQWDAALPAYGFSDASIDKLYLPQDTTADAPNVAAQEADPDSLLHHVRALLNLRKQHPSLGSRGTLTQLNSALAPYPVIFRRDHAGKAFLVAVNPLAQAVSAQVQDCPPPSAPLLGTTHIETHNHSTGFTLHMQPFSHCIAEISQ